MSVKPELAFDVCWEVYRARSAGIEARDFCTELEGYRQIFMEAGLSAAAERVGG